MKKVPVGMPVGALAFLPSGKKIVAASTEERIGIWDWESGKRLFATEGYGSNGLAVSPNGALVVSGCRDGGLKIWKVSSDGILSDMAGLTRGSVGPMTFCGNKRTVIYATRDVISWDFEKHTVKVLYSPKDRNFAINALGCSLDGNMAAVGFANGQIVIWDIAANKQAGRIIESCSDSKELRSIKCIAFSSQNDVFATGGIDHTVRLWNAASGTQTAILRGHSDGVTSIAFSSDGKYLASVTGMRSDVPGEIIIWDVTKEIKIAQFLGHSSGIRCVSFSPDGSILATGGFDGMLLWDLQGSLNAG